MALYDFIVYKTIECFKHMVTPTPVIRCHDLCQKPLSLFFRHLINFHDRIQ